MAQPRKIQGEQAGPGITSGKQGGLAQVISARPNQAPLLAENDQKLSNQALRSMPVRETTTVPYYSNIQIPTASEVWQYVVTYLKTHKTPYVHVAVVAKAAARIVILVCIFSLILSASTKFNMINPFI